MASAKSDFGNQASALTELLDVLALERTGDDRFEGRHLDQGLGKVFGGQLVGQGLSAAQQTAPNDRGAHSVHTQFLDSASPDQPLSFHVARVRDTRRFSTRRVDVTQDGSVICTVAVSFHDAEPGHDHQAADPGEIADPESLQSERQLCDSILDALPAPVRAVLPQSIIDSVMGERAFELRPVAHFANPIAPKPLAPRQPIWFRCSGDAGADLAVHQRLLAFASDFHFLGTSMRPHGLTIVTPGVSAASLDHSIWFHRPARCDEWLLHDMESPSAQKGRGFVRGQWFTRAGTLIASTSQEALIRDRRLASAVATPPASSQ